MTLNIAEETLAAQLKQARIAFMREFVYAPPRKFRADFVLPAFRLLVEVNGGIFNRKTHGSVTGVLKDMERGNEAAMAGWYVLRVTPDEVADGRALALVQRVIARHEDQARWL